MVSKTPTLIQGRWASYIIQIIMAVGLSDCALIGPATNIEFKDFFS